MTLVHFDMHGDGPSTFRKIQGNIVTRPSVQGESDDGRINQIPYTWRIV